MFEKPPGLHHITEESSRSTCQFMAAEGACFVLVCTQILIEVNEEKIKLNDSPFVQTVRQV